MRSRKREHKMMMTPKPQSAPPVNTPSVVLVKPNWAAQSFKIPARTPKPTPDAKIVKKPAQSSFFACGDVPFVMLRSLVEALRKEEGPDFTGTRRPGSRVPLFPK